MGLEISPSVFTYKVQDYYSVPRLGGQSSSLEESYTMEYCYPVKFPLSLLTAYRRGVPTGSEREPLPVSRIMNSPTAMDTQYASPTRDARLLFNPISALRPSIHAAFWHTLFLFCSGRCCIYAIRQEASPLSMEILTNVSANPFHSTVHTLPDPIRAR